MHPCGPGQQFAMPILGQAPVGGDLVEGFQRLAFDPRSLFNVHVVALHKEAQGAVADVFVVMAAKQVVEHTFAQGSFGVSHAVQLQRIENGFKNRQAGGEDPTTIRFHPFDIDFLHVAQLEKLALDVAYAFPGDFAIAHIEALDGQSDSADGAGSADCILPAKTTQAMFDAHQFQAGGSVGLGITRGGNLAVAEEALGEAHAAHLQALAQIRIEAFADDEFGTASANVYHQPPAGGTGEGVSDSQVNQAGLLAAGDYFHLMIDDGFGLANEHGAVASFTQRIGADHADRALGQVIDHLRKAAQAVEAAFHGAFVEGALFGDAGGQLHLFAKSFEDAYFTVADARQYHVETVRSQIETGDQRKGVGSGWRHERIISLKS